MSGYQLAPTDKQIKFADAIAETLHIDFPLSSHDFNKVTYGRFISKNIQAYYDIVNNYAINYTMDDYGYNDYCWGFSHPEKEF